MATPHAAPAKDTAAAATGTAAGTSWGEAGVTRRSYQRKGQITLPDETRQKLAELHRDYLNEELTEKGYKIRKGKLLTLYASGRAFCEISETKSMPRISLALLGLFLVPSLFLILEFTF